ncbi:MltR family transcriptional regulator [Sinorhizobium fredii]|uniref:MltR family transcriptional regulator n=1 Tax=Rhizobium fredii TaxID=380 RepID=UPI0012FDF3E4|nr:MltR family transcriptional regulator [Sinorhizobium fredii]
MSKNSPVQRVADALFKEAIARARREVDALQFDVSDMPDVFHRLTRESETAQVLVFGSYLEDRISSLIKVRMRHLESKNAESALFGPTGPLATFGGRTLLAYHLGWLSADTKQKLDCFRKIRNEFAHRAFKASFSDQPIQSLFKKIEYNPERMLDVISEALEDLDDRHIIIANEELTTEKRSLCNLAYLAEHVFRDLITRPIAIANRVPDFTLVGEYDDAPKLIQDLYRNLARSLMFIIHRTHPRWAAL